MSDTSQADAPSQGEVSGPKERRKVNLRWTISMFGTAVGAGILFLPMSAGAGGLWPLLIVTVLIGPMAYLSHRALGRFVLATEEVGDDVTVAADEHFGHRIGRGITVLYFLSIYPIVLIYGVSITNTVDSLLVEQLGLPSIPRPVLAFVLIAAMQLVMVFGEKLMLRAFSVLVYPLILVLGGFMLYLIPSWDFASFAGPFEPGKVAMSVWLVIPVMVFAFSFAPAISQFSLAMERLHGVEKAPEESSKVLRNATALLTVFSMGFVWSCALALGTEGLADATESNLPVLSYLANVRDEPLISYTGPIIAMAAIASSFFGHYLGTAEGGIGLVRAVRPSVDPDSQRTKWAVALFIFVTTWLAAVLNPSILDLIESLSGPMLAAILYIMPMVAIYTVPALARYRKQWISNLFVTVAGLFAIAGVVFSLIT